MKNCILKYGQFTSIVKTTTLMDEISVMHPNATITMYDLSDNRPIGTRVEDNRLTFQLREQLNEDTYLYEWKG